VTPGAVVNVIVDVSCTGVEIRRYLRAVSHRRPEVNRRSFLSTMALLVAPLGVEAQQPGRVYQLGHLSYESGPSL